MRRLLSVLRNRRDREAGDPESGEWMPALSDELLAKLEVARAESRVRSQLLREKVERLRGAGGSL